MRLAEEITQDDDDQPDPVLPEAHERIGHAVEGA
jgi:hypothetical protein